MFPNLDDIKRVRSIRSEGFNPEADEFPDFLGLDKGDFQYLTKIVELIEEEADNFHEAFQKVYELASYATDEVVRAFLFFHLGAIVGRKITLKSLEKADKEIFTHGYKEGFAEGFKSGFEKGLEMGEYIKRKVENKEENN